MLITRLVYGRVEIAADCDVECGGVTEARERAGIDCGGKYADLLLVEGNPAEDIGNIRRSRLVIKDGTVYQSDAVYAAAGIKPAN